MTRCFYIVVGLIGLAGCAVSPDAEEAYGESDEALTSRPRTTTVDLKYEGTCQFLRNCSSWSKGLPVGHVLWGCDGEGACSDSALWVAGPTRAYCGKTVRICKGGRCVNAKVKDVSVSQDWEASNGVLDGLDIDHKLTGECSGAGGGRVTVTVP
jgi:hypothetical protein